MTRPEMKMEYVSYDRAKGREHMEEKNVMISITGLQKVDGVEQEPVELITPGVLSQVGGGYHLTYRETALTGLEGTITSFQVYPDQVSMVRMGTVCLQMVFEKGRRHLSVYETPYGNMSVGVRTEQLTSTLGESGGVIDIKYALEIDHGRKDADQGARCAPFGLSGGLLGESIRQAEGLLSGSWRIYRGGLATPVFQLAKRSGKPAEACAQALAETVDLTGTWFVKAVPVGGYLNLTFAPAWYDAAAREPAPAGTPVTTPVPPMPDFPAEIFAGDWRCLCRTQKKCPTAQLAARQDAGNPAWLVRYTAQRLQRLAEREALPASQAWTEGEQALLLLAAALARQVWRERCFEGGAAQRCARVLAAGYKRLSQP